MSTLTSRPIEQRTLHFDLSHTRPGVEHTLHVGARRHLLKPHTDATRQRHRASCWLLAHIPDKRLTHYLEDIEFPANAVQSFYITHPHEKAGGLPRLSERVQRMSCFASLVRSVLRFIPSMSAASVWLPLARAITAAISVRSTLTFTMS